MNKSLLIASILALLPGSSYCQLADERIGTKITPIGDGGSEVEVVNRSSEPITALVVVAEGIPFSIGANAPITVYYYDSVRHYWKDQPIMPNGSWRVALGALPAKETHISLKAAIFEGGSIYGDPDWANKILSIRRFCVEKLSVALDRLSAARQSATSRQDLIGQFTALLDDVMKNAQSHEEKGAAHEVFGSVIGSLSNGAFANAPVPVEQTLSTGIDQLLQLRQRLLASKPSVSAVPGL